MRNAQITMPAESEGLARRNYRRPLQRLQRGDTREKQRAGIDNGCTIAKILGMDNATKL